MKKEIKFPKGATNINFDLVNGVATATYEEVKTNTLYCIWYENRNKNQYILKIDNITENGFNVGFVYGNWKTDLLCSGSENWKPANMKCVEKLLITEAEKKGHKYDQYTIRDGAFYGIEGGTMITELLNFETGEWREIIPEETELERLTKIAKEKGLVDEVEYESLECFDRVEVIREPFHLGCAGNLIDANSNIIYYEQEDLWAKPILFTNSKETHFCEGDKCFYVEKESFQIFEGSVSDGGFGEDSTFTEIMTKKQCYQWLADNCKE